ncbi:MAG TPA: sulfatase-like hydrolase/transferase [Polyangiaceae bacterium]|nr:sulfatase-like hydrolase/transferase [Polyangiaceae bacterium]
MSSRLGWALLATAGVGVPLVDLAVRGEQIVCWPRSTIAGYAATAVLGGVLWVALVVAAARPRAWLARVLLLAGATMAVGAQLYFFGRYHAFLNPRAVLVGTSMMPSVRQQLWSDRGSFVRALAIPVATAVLLPMAVRRWARALPARRGMMALDLGVAALLVATFVLPVAGGNEQAASPDVLYLASLGRLAYARWDHDDAVSRAHPGHRSPAPVPKVPAETRRSVLLVVTESVRGADTCSAPADDCAATPYTNTLMPDRFGLTQMRALDSTTAVSLAVLWAGLPPTASREALHTAPLLWEYAHAAGFDTAYWTAQNMFFANSGTWLEGVPVSRWVTATDLDADATYEVGADDGKLVDVVLRDLPQMGAPFVGVVHLSNTHFPYVIDENDAPFQPQSHAFGAGDTVKVRNRYLDAIRRQDAIVARLVRGVRAMPGGDRVAVVFVSDHGEQIRERGAIGHTWGVYDEEVRVPFWVDAPRGMLREEQEESLRSLRDVPVTQLDVLPTVLDMMGIWDAPQIGGFRRDMPGQSLLRGGTPERPVVLTNCSDLFACAFKNWGAMHGARKLVATQNDSRWHCFDVIEDPREKSDLGEDACPDLRELAQADGRGAPF